VITSGLPALRYFILICLIFFSFASQAKAACLQFNFGGHWQLYQDNGYRVLFDLQQGSDGSLRGMGSFVSTRHVPAGGAFNALYSGTLSGNTSGSTIHLTASWGGNYEGTVQADGGLAGSTQPMLLPSPHVSWHVENRKVPCLFTRPLRFRFQR
jgi:hypothetical protein